MRLAFCHLGRLTTGSFTVSTKREAFEREQRVLDRLFVGETLGASRAAEGFAGRYSYRIFFRNARLRRAAFDRLAAGERLPPVALRGLKQADHICATAPQPVSSADMLAEVRAAVLALRADVRALREDVRDFVRCIELALPDDAVIDEAIRYSSRVEHGRGMVTAAVREAQEHYNPISLAKLRRAILGWPKMFASLPHVSC